MLERNYKKLEKIIVLIMMLGIIAMFQPWFKNIVELFEPLAPEARLGRTFKNEIAPIILRYGFYATFLSTVAFIVISHHSVEDLQKAFREKGVPLTLLLIVLPVLYGFIVLAHLSQAHYYAALLGVINVVCAIAVWNWKRWGLIGLGLTALVELGLTFSGSASIPTAALILVAIIALVSLTWPRRTAFS
jgi:hypothetical protein